MHVASVIAANGAGHFRRSVGVLHRLMLSEPSTNITVYCTGRQLKVMGSWWRLRQLSEMGTQFITDFECGFSWPLASYDHDLLAWRDQLSHSEALHSADLVVSDNLASVLSIRPDAVLMGSFLWSEILAHLDQPQTRRFVDDELSSLRAHHPPMLCVQGIVTPGVLKETSAVQLSWMCETPAPEPRKLVTSPRIGVCGGTTDAATAEVVQLAEWLAPMYDVVVDAAADLDKLRHLPGVRSGLQRDIPLTEVDIVLCRPGAGTVMDCVAANIPFLTFSEPNSPEMDHSAGRLSSTGVAGSLTQRLSAEQVLGAVAYLANPLNYQTASAKLHALPKDGLDLAAGWLAERLSTSPWREVRA